MKVISLLFTLTLSARLGLAGPIVKCADLTSIPFGSEVKIESGKMAPPGPVTPERCAPPAKPSP